MTTQKTILFSFLILLIVSCGQVSNKDVPQHPDWITLNLPNGWTLQTPKNFKNSTRQGIDSDPGIIYSKLDSITLEYDSGTELLQKTECDFQKQIESAKDSYLLTIYKERTGTDHELYVDTIGSRIASIIIPTKTGKGNTHITLKDCSTGSWLGIKGSNLTEDQQRRVLEIFRTLRQQSDEK